MITIRAFTCDDLDFGMKLKAQAGWNQTVADWRRFLAIDPEGAFLAECHGGPVGTVFCCRFGSVAWVAMMLVDESLRRRGIGRALMNEALRFADANGVSSVRLDATPLGRPLYESLGFRADATILRHEGKPRIVAPDVGRRIGPITEVEALAHLDQIATGTDRSRLLIRMFHEDAGAFSLVDDSNEAAFVWSRPGTRGRQIGPCVALAEGNGRGLLAAELARITGQSVVVDVPECHEAALGLVRDAGLSVARSLTRMTRGPAIAERLDLIWAGYGPELG